MRNRSLYRVNCATIGSRVYDSVAEMIFRRYNRSVTQGSMLDDRSSSSVEVNEPSKEFQWLNDCNLGRIKRSRELEPSVVPQVDGDHDRGGLDLGLSLGISDRKW